MKRLILRLMGILLVVLIIAEMSYNLGWWGI